MRGWISGILVASSWCSVGLLCWSLSGGAGLAGDSAGEVPLADGFDWPVGDARRAGTNHHLGEDWNGRGGGDSDYGAPVHSAAAGVVSFVGSGGPGWGRVVRIVHRYRDDSGEHEVETLYAHLSADQVEVGQVVRRGQPIGAIGDADGIDVAHLHFELRSEPGLPLDGGYGTAPRDLSPSDFVRAHRPAP